MIKSEPQMVRCVATQMNGEEGTASGGAMRTSCHKAASSQQWCVQHPHSHALLTHVSFLPCVCSDPEGWLSIQLHYTGSHIERASSIGNNPKQVWRSCGIFIESL